MINELISGNVICSGIGAVLYSSVRAYQQKDSRLVESFIAGSIGTIVVQKLVYIYARYKVDVNKQTPDTYTYEYLKKQPNGNVIRLTGVVAGLALLHYWKE